MHVAGIKGLIAGDGERHAGDRYWHYDSKDSRDRCGRRCWIPLLRYEPYLLRISVAAHWRRTNRRLFFHRSIHRSHVVVDRTA
jgi:hypothetical protein